MSKELSMLLQMHVAENETFDDYDNVKIFLVLSVPNPPEEKCSCESESVCESVCESATAFLFINIIF